MVQFKASCSQTLATLRGESIKFIDNLWSI